MTVAAARTFVDERTLVPNVDTVVLTLTVPAEEVWFPRLIVVSHPTPLALYGRVQLKPVDKSQFYDVEMLTLTEMSPSPGSPIHRYQPLAAWGAGDQCRLVLNAAAATTVRTLVNVVAEQT